MLLVIFDFKLNMTVNKKYVFCLAFQLEIIFIHIKWALNVPFSYKHFSPTSDPVTAIVKATSDLRHSSLNIFINTTVKFYFLFLHYLMTHFSLFLFLLNNKIKTIFLFFSLPPPHYFQYCFCFVLFSCPFTVPYFHYCPWTVHKAKASLSKRIVQTNGEHFSFCLIISSVFESLAHENQL